MDPTSLIVAGAVALLTLLIVSVLAIRSPSKEEEHRPRIREIRQAPVTPLDALIPGYDAIVEGRVAAKGSALTSPLSGRPCVCYRLWIAHDRINDRIEVRGEDSMRLYLARRRTAREPAKGRGSGPF